MIEKINIRHLVAIVGVGLAINFLFVGCGKSSSIDELQTNTDRTVGTLKAESAIVGIEIERSQTASGNALEAIGRTQLEISRSRETAGNLNAGIEKLQTILGECESLTRENQNVIDRVDSSN